MVIMLSKNGGAPVVVPGRPSGSQTLDEAALTMTRLAAERTPVPAELQGRNLRIPLRIRFTLDDF
jgi:outer membrane biosynthesis protein TonB